ncbi:MAG: CPBP family intramembrane glutamic endopeptidase, partial [Terracidiphilus sp.]
MEPEMQPTPEEPPAAETDFEQVAAVDSPAPRRRHDLSWLFLGEEGLRAGWSVLLFSALTFAFLVVASLVVMSMLKALRLNPSEGMSAGSTIRERGVWLLAFAGAGWMVARIEGRRLVDFYLRGRQWLLHFATGLVTGFATLSVLVGVLSLGGWLHFGAPALTGGRILLYAGWWSAGFLLVGLTEEGSFRCYLQFTLTRGLNFWWALGIVAFLSGDLLLRAKGNGAWGVYVMALLGLVPCLLLELRKAPGSGFWQAAWVTSTAFGFIHTGNNGENWIGIFAAGAIGFVFCVSVRVTGSAWWAIGCHAAWDWAETYFYGTADSGMPARGHFLT